MDTIEHLNAFKEQIISDMNEMIISIVSYCVYCGSLSFLLFDHRSWGLNGKSFVLNCNVY